ncbi:hypothetical protein [Mesorhizobium temperatum]|uniref:hypothetical protein n=1 Tax=Mesorhizobium temperatum TaxID=241416 RepID=UPI00142E54B3|nr:hypothetical protein [Mesorhizobium temperatum]
MTDPAAGWLRGTTSAAAGWMPTSAVNNSEKLAGPRIAVLKRPLFERLYDGSFIELSNTPLQQIAEYGKRCCPDTQHRKTGAIVRAAVTYKQLSEGSSKWDHLRRLKTRG